MLVELRSYSSGSPPLLEYQANTRDGILERLALGTIRLEQPASVPEFRQQGQICLYRGKDFLVQMQYPRIGERDHAIWQNANPGFFIPAGIQARNRKNYQSLSSDETVQIEDLLGHAISLSESPAERAGLYLLFLSHCYQGYRRPATEIPQFYESLKQFTGDTISREEFFSPWFNNKPNLAGVEYRLVAEGTLFHPYWTMILDYLWKAWQPEALFREYAPEVYRAFLQVFLGDKQAQEFIVTELNKNVINGFSTHPDFVNALASISQFPDSSGDPNMDLSRPRRESRRLQDDIAKKMTKLFAKKTHQIEREVEIRRVYTTTIPDRYQGSFANMLDNITLPEEIAVIDAGAGIICAASATFIRLAAERGIRTRGLLATERVIAPPLPPAIASLVPEDEYLSVRARTEAEETALARDVSINSWMHRHPNPIILDCNSMRPHHAPTQVLNNLAEIFSIKPEVLVLLGGFYICRWAFLQNSGSELHVFARNKKNPKRYDFMRLPHLG